MTETDGLSRYFKRFKKTDGRRGWRGRGKSGEADRGVNIVGRERAGMDDRVCIVHEEKFVRFANVRVAKVLEVAKADYGLVAASTPVGDTSFTWEGETMDVFEETFMSDE
jgi:hypothetical protein